MDLTFEMVPWQWGDTCRWDRETDRMVPTIVAGKRIKFSIDFSLLEARSRGWHIFAKGEEPGDLELRSLAPGANLCYFKGRVLERMEIPGPPKVASLRGTKIVSAILDSKLPLLIQDAVQESDVLDINEGDIIEGTAHLRGSASDEGLYTAGIPLEATVKAVFQFGPIPMRGKEEGYHHITVTVDDPAIERAIWMRTWLSSKRDVATHHPVESPS